MIVLVMYYVAMSVIAMSTLAASTLLLYAGMVWQPLVVLAVGSCMFYAASNRRYDVTSGKPEVTK